MKSVIIDRLISIEENAQSITKDVEEKEYNLPVLVQKKCDEIDQRLKSDFEKKSAAVSRQKEDETTKKIDEIKNDSANRYKKLDDYYEENHEQWEKDIFNIIVGR